ncbi:hypothetical protein EDD86DRAFT_265373 [Gorgonomyces haynaldii]|nr:hypothetical protein EDD86DRAFT_265373 [Gorgonomyces haynaldii]
MDPKDYSHYLMSLKDPSLLLPSDYLLFSKQYPQLIPQLLPFLQPTRDLAILEHLLHSPYTTQALLILSRDWTLEVNRIVEKWLLISDDGFDKQFAIQSWLSHPLLDLQPFLLSEYHKSGHLNGSMGFSHSNASIEWKGINQHVYSLILLEHLMTRKDIELTETLERMESVLETPFKNLFYIALVPLTMSTSRDTIISKNRHLAKKLLERLVYVQPERYQESELSFLNHRYQYLVKLTVDLLNNDYKALDPMWHIVYWTGQVFEHPKEALPSLLSIPPHLAMSMVCFYNHLLQTSQDPWTLNYIISQSLPHLAQSDQHTCHVVSKILSGLCSQGQVVSHLEIVSFKALTNLWKSQPRIWPVLKTQLNIFLSRFRHISRGNIKPSEQEFKNEQDLERLVSSFVKDICFNYQNVGQDIVPIIVGFWKLKFVQDLSRQDYILGFCQLVEAGMVKPRIAWKVTIESLWKDIQKDSVVVKREEEDIKFKNMILVDYLAPLLQSDVFESAYEALSKFPIEDIQPLLPDDFLSFALQYQSGPRLLLQRLIQDEVQTMGRAMFKGLVLSKQQEQSSDLQSQFESLKSKIDKKQAENQVYFRSCYAIISLSFDLDLSRLIADLPDYDSPLMLLDAMRLMSYCCQSYCEPFKRQKDQTVLQSIIQDLKQRYESVSTPTLKCNAGLLLFHLVQFSGKAHLYSDYLIQSVQQVQYPSLLGCLLLFCGHFSGLLDDDLRLYQLLSSFVDHKNDMVQFCAVYAIFLTVHQRKDKLQRLDGLQDSLAYAFCLEMLLQSSDLQLPLSKEQDPISRIWTLKSQITLDQVSKQEAQTQLDKLLQELIQQKHWIGVEHCYLALFQTWDEQQFQSFKIHQDFYLEQVQLRSLGYFYGADYSFDRSLKLLMPLEQVIGSMDTLLERLMTLKDSKTLRSCGWSLSQGLFLLKSVLLDQQLGTSDPRDYRRLGKDSYLRQVTERLPGTTIDDRQFATAGSVPRCVAVDELDQNLLLAGHQRSKIPSSVSVPFKTNRPRDMQIYRCLVHESH